jgi:hypothetical protein
MPETTIEFKITFNTTTTSYYTMVERIYKAIKGELRKAYYDVNDSQSSDSDSDDISIADLEEVEINNYNLNPYIYTNEEGQV